MCIAYPARPSISGTVAVAVCAALYLGVGGLGYALSADVPRGLSDPWLHACLFAWPALLVLALLKWILLAALACLALIGALVARDVLRERRDGGAPVPSDTAKDTDPCAP